jgi:glycosidase
MRVILDIVFNHSGTNWIYANGELTPRLSFPGAYQKGDWFDAKGGRVGTIAPDAGDDGAWPSELQRDDYYTRAGGGAGGHADFAGDFDDAQANFRRTDLPTDAAILISTTRRCLTTLLAAISIGLR